MTAKRGARYRYVLGPLASPPDEAVADACERHPLPPLGLRHRRWLPQGGLQLVERLHQSAFGGKVDPDDVVHPHGPLRTLQDERHETPLALAQVENFRDDRFLFRVPALHVAFRDQRQRETAAADASLHL